MTMNVAKALGLYRLEWGLAQRPNERPSLVDIDIRISCFPSITSIDLHPLRGILCAMVDPRGTGNLIDYSLPFPAQKISLNCWSQRVRVAGISCMELVTRLALDKDCNYKRTEAREIDMQNCLLERGQVSQKDMISDTFALTM
jgi:hypothetical protein